MDAFVLVYKFYTWVTDISQ